MKKGEKHLIGPKTDFIWNIAKKQTKTTKNLYRTCKWSYQIKLPNS